MSRPWREPRLTPDEKDGSGKFSKFAGLVNTRSRKDLGLDALYVGDNVLISDTNKVRRRDGYSLYRAGNFQTAFGLGNNLYVVDAGVLQQLTSPTDVITLASGLTGVDYGWGELNGDAYYANGIEAGIVRGNTHTPWRLTVPTITSLAVVTEGTLPSTTLNMGRDYASAKWRFCATYETADGRETAPSDIFEIQSSPVTALFKATIPPAYARTNIYASEPDGVVFRLATQTTSDTATFNPLIARRELTTLGTSSLPTSVYMFDFFQGRCYAAEYIPQVDISIVWVSKSLAYHLYDQANDFIMLPGKVGVLVWCNEGMIVGTSQKIYQIKDSGELNLLVNYGVVPGLPGDTDAESVAYFWTQRGICKAMPFENLSEKDVSMPPGLRAASKMIYLNGMQQFVTVTQGGGEPFNARTERT